MTVLPAMPSALAFNEMRYHWAFFTGTLSWASITVAWPLPPGSLIARRSAHVPSGPARWRVQAAWRDSEENCHWPGIVPGAAAWLKSPFRTTEAPGFAWSSPTGIANRDNRGVGAETPMLASSRVRAKEARR